MGRIKICGITSEKEIHWMNQYRPDYVGFVFAKSKRQITHEQAKKFRGLLHKEILAVGVFVNETLDNILALCEQGIIQMIQLHGDEDKEYIRKLKEKTSVLVMKAIHVGESFDQSTMDLPADCFLLDARLNHSYGGNGIPFDWSILPTMDCPYFLAGGLSKDNIVKAINQLHPYGVDVSSGVEGLEGKDELLLQEFIALARDEYKKQRIV